MTSGILITFNIFSLKEGYLFPPLSTLSEVLHRLAGFQISGCFESFSKEQLSPQMKKFFLNQTPVPDFLIRRRWGISICICISTFILSFTGGYFSLYRHLLCNNCNDIYVALVSLYSNFHANCHFCLYCSLSPLQA